MANDSTAATSVEVIPAPSSAHIAARAELVRAIQRYNALARRARSADAWAAIECRLWNARAEAVRLGALIKRHPETHKTKPGALTDEYVFVSDRYEDAGSKRQHARLLEELLDLAQRKAA